MCWDGMCCANMDAVSKEGGRIYNQVNVVGLELQHSGTPAIHKMDKGMYVEYQWHEWIGLRMDKENESDRSTSSMGFCRDNVGLCSSVKNTMAYTWNNALISLSRQGYNHL